MKNIILFLLFCLPLGAWAQEIMTVHKTDGSTVDFYVDEVQRVTFATRELVNQYDLNGTLSDVTAVLEWHDGDSLTYMLNATGEGTLQPSAPVAVRIAAADFGKQLAYEGGEAAAPFQIMIDGHCAVLQNAIVKVAKDKLGKTLTLTIEAKMAGGGSLYAMYRGSFSVDYADNQSCSYRPAEGAEEISGTMSSLLRCAAATGTSVSFGLGDASAATAAGMHAGRFGVVFTLSASRVYSGEIDLAANPSAYQLKVYDYLLRTTTEAASSTTGTISTLRLGDNIYICIDVTLEGGLHVAASYKGAATDVESLDEMWPQAGDTNSLQVIEADGSTVRTDVPIVALQRRDGTDGMTYFYIMKNETDDPDDYYVTPMLKVRTDLIGTGEISLAETEANTWAVKFQGFQLSSADNEYMNRIDNGTLSVTPNAAGDEVEVRLFLRNSYRTPWGGDTPSGTMDYLKLYWKGNTSAYTGSK